MNQSENINELATALSKAQGEMQAAIKDSINPFFKSKYADLGSVWDAARPVLSKNGLCIMQGTEMIGEKIVMVTTLAHSSGQWVKSFLPLNPSKNDSQGVGAAITYLRRYSLSALVGVVCDDDDDGETAVGRGQPKEDHKKHQKASTPPFTNNIPKPNELVDAAKITKEQLEEILKLKPLADQKWVESMEKHMRDNLNIYGYEDVPMSEYNKILNSLKNNIENNKKKVA